MLTRRAMLGRFSAAAGAMCAAQAGIEPVAADGRSAVTFEIPHGACDCHVHVFGPVEQFPFAQKRIYTPPPASVERLLELQSDLHLERVVVVQPSVYGTDNACTLDAIRRLGARARGIAVIDRAASRKSLEEMAAGGIRAFVSILRRTALGDLMRAMPNLSSTSAADQIAGLGWHVQMYTRPSVIAALRDHILRMPFPVVLDHFGRADPAQDHKAPDFVALLDLMRSGQVYVKISGAYRISESGPEFANVAPLARASVVATIPIGSFGDRLAASEFGLWAGQAIDHDFTALSDR